MGLCPSPAARGLGCWPAPARLRAVPSAADCPPGVPGTPRDWRQPWLRVPVVLTLPAPRQPFLLLQGGKGSPEPVPRRAQPCGHRPGVAATPRCYLQAEFGAELINRGRIVSVAIAVCPVTQAAPGHHGDIFIATLPGGLLSPVSRPTPNVSVPQSKPCLMLELCPHQKHPGGNDALGSPSSSDRRAGAAGLGVELLCHSLHLSCEILMARDSSPARRR